MTEDRKGNEGNRIKQIKELPNSGRYLIDDVAELMGYEPGYFRKQIKADPTIRTIKWHKTIIIDMAWLFEDWIKHGNDFETAEKAPFPKTKRVRSKPRPKIGKTELPLSTVTPE